MSDMGSDAPFRQTPRKDQAIVAFDFDGTLTIRDSFTEFLRWRAGAGGWALGLVKLAPAVAAYARGRDRGRIKARPVSGPSRPGPDPRGRPPSRRAADPPA